MSKSRRTGGKAALPAKRPPPGERGHPARTKPPTPEGAAFGGRRSAHSPDPAPARRRPPPGSVSGMTNDPADRYEIGYGKPPKSGQIKPGEVKNPRGRGAKGQIVDDESLVAAFLAELGQSVKITEGSKSKRMRKVRVLAKSVVNNAMKGDNPAFRSLITLMQKAGTRSSDNASSQMEDANITQTDTAILEQFRLQCIEEHLKSKGPAK